MLGLCMQAETDDAKSEALARATVRVLETLQWLDDRSFMSNAQLGRWEHLVRLLCSCPSIDRLAIAKCQVSNSVAAK